jgi:hypothetical protein
MDLMLQKGFFHLPAADRYPKNDDGKDAKHGFVQLFHGRIKCDSYST